MRNPRRTAATASALMIGLALVTMFSVLGQSAKASVDNSIKQEFLGDYVVKTTGLMFGNFSPTVEPKIAAVPGVAATSPERTGNAKFGSSTATLTAVNANSIGQLLKIDVKSGSLSSLSRGEIMVEKNTASSKGLKVGSPIQLRFAKTGEQTLVVGGTYAYSQLIGTNYLVSTKVFEANFTDQLDQVVMVKIDSNADPVAVRNGIDQAISAYPNVTVQNPAQVEKDQASQVNQLLTIIYVLLALGHPDRGARHHQYAGPVGGRTDPGVRPAARPRHGPPTGAHHGQRRISGDRPVRRHIGCAGRPRLWGSPHLGDPQIAGGRGLRPRHQPGRLLDPGHYLRNRGCGVARSAGGPHQRDHGFDVRMRVFYAARLA